MKELNGGSMVTPSVCLYSASFLICLNEAESLRLLITDITIVLCLVVALSKQNFCWNLLLQLSILQKCFLVKLFL